jgi:pyruvate/2-oxoglutarate dehydrogenase complex dihydrolipoamide acyltransferase (E2) component
LPVPIRDPGRDRREIIFSPYRLLISDAARLAKKKDVIYGLTEFDITDTMKKIRRLRVADGAPLSLTAFIAHCIGRAVEKNPRVHGYRRGNRLVLFADVDLCLPVEIRIGEDLVPVIHILRRVNRKSLREIEDEIRTVRETGIHHPGFRQISSFLRWFSRLPFILRRVFYTGIIRNPDRFRKYMGTVALTAVGMFGAGGGWGLGLSNHTLEVVTGGISRKPLLRDGDLENRQFLAVTIAVDHDVVDGAPGARFARHLRELVEKGSGLPPAS